MPDAIDMTQFVPKWFEMDPKTDDLIRSGRFLEDGMVVLLEVPDYRLDLEESGGAVERRTNPAMVAQALKWNRWVTVSDPGYAGDELCAFVGVYADGTKKSIEVPDRLAWYVKKKSMPPTADEIDDAGKKDLQERGIPVERLATSVTEGMRQYGRQ